MASRFIKMMTGTEDRILFSELVRNRSEDCSYTNMKSKAYRFGKNSTVRTYICPYCGNRIDIWTTSVDINCAVNSKPDTDAKIFYRGHDFDVYCDKCNNMSMFECDTLIANSMSIFISKGYTTEFCCEGHLLPFIDLCSVPYAIIVDEDGTLFEYASKLLDKHPEFNKYIVLGIKEDLIIQYIQTGIRLMQVDLENTKKGLYKCLTIYSNNEGYHFDDLTDEENKRKFIEYKNKFLMFVNMFANQLPNIKEEK